MPMAKAVGCTASPTWRFPKIRVTTLGVPIRRTVVYEGLHWGPLILGNYHMSFSESDMRIAKAPGNITVFLGVGLGGFALGSGFGI